jgi:hypothetical protein
VGPLVPVLVATCGWTVALATGSAAAVLGAALWLAIRVDRPAPAAVVAAPAPAL